MVATSTCKSGEELQGLLCYPKCRASYTPVGPVCRQQCPSTHRNDGAFCAKKSYGRGVGTVLIPTCNSNEELNGLLCYPKRRSGYGGVGPLCWERCRSGYTDHGLTCFKHIFSFYAKGSYGRGFGRIPSYGCPFGKENDAALCYNRCNSGYTGVGPLCWASGCPSGMTSIGVSCAKHSYTRSSRIPDYLCGSGPDKELLLCYPQCRPGFAGIGPVCWKDGCPTGMTDIGVSCSKASYGRTAGKPANSKCGSGEENDAGLCYKNCRDGFGGVGPVCGAMGCPPGMTYIGVACSKKTEGRGVGVVPGSCDSKSFTRNPPTKTSISGNSFTMIFSNDPQIVWWDSAATGITCTNDDCKKEKSEKEALEQVRAMNAVTSLGNWPRSSKPIKRPVGVIINGDLTSYFHPDEFDLFEKYYVKGTNVPHPEVLGYPIYLSLGNHDYANNRDIGDQGCYWLRELDYAALLEGGCSQKAVDFIKGMVSCGAVEGFPSDQVESYHANSLAYSWNIENYHFVQLHNYPSYNASDIGISSSMGWLQEDLIRAKAAKKDIIVNLYDYGDHFKGTDKDWFNTIVEDSGVLAVFCGHATGVDNLGYMGNVGGTSIPVFRGRHAGQDKRN